MPITNIFDNISNSKGNEIVRAFGTNTGGAIGYSGLYSAVLPSFSTPEGTFIYKYDRLNTIAEGSGGVPYGSGARNFKETALTPKYDRLCFLKIRVKSVFRYYDNINYTWKTRTDGYKYIYIPVAKNIDYSGVINSVETFSGGSAYDIPASEVIFNPPIPYTGEITDSNASKKTDLNALGTYIDYVHSDDNNAIVKLLNTLPFTTTNQYTITYSLVNSTSNFFTDENSTFSIVKKPNDTPIFDIQNTEAIAEFLNNGVILPDSDIGVSDAGTPATPPAYTLDDYTTLWRAYISKGDGNGRMAFDWINADVEELDSVDKEKVKIAFSTQLDFMTTIWEGGYRQQPYTINLKTLSIHNGWRNSTGSAVGTHHLYFFMYTGAGNSHIFDVKFTFDDKSTVGVNIDSVKCYPTSITSDIPVTKTSDGEFEVYTANSGDVLKIRYSAITVEDVADRDKQLDTDTGYTHGSGDKEAGDYGDTTAVNIATGNQQTYRVSGAMMDAIHDFLWGTDWVSTWHNVTNNLMDCIVSLKSIPFLRSGNVVSGVPLGSGVVKQSGGASRINPAGEYTLVSGYVIPHIYNSFLDYSPFTKLAIWLPYIGFQELPCDEVMDKPITIKYLVDFVNGLCKALIIIDGYTKFDFDGNCAIDIPMTGSNNARVRVNSFFNGMQTGLGNVSNAFSSIMSGMQSGGVAGAIVSGVTTMAKDGLGTMQDAIPHWEYPTTKSPMSYCDAMCPNSIYIIIDSPDVQYPASYNHIMGKPCMLTLNLGTISGYTECANVDVSGFNATEQEREEIKRIMESGIYL